jgi:hypothetical protein
MDKQRKHIKFIEATHQYFNVETGEKYTSCTTFLSQYHEKFDADKIAENLILNVPKYRSQYSNFSLAMGINLLKAEWKKRTDIGNFIHNKLEDYLKGNDVFDADKGQNWNNRIKQLISAWDDLMLFQRYHDYEFIPEMLLFNDDLKLAGQSDLVLLNHEKKTFIVMDYKTNKKGIEKASYQNKLMYPPVEHLMDCNYNHYALQLNLYAYFLGQELGYKMDELMLLLVNTNSSNKCHIKEIKIPLMERELNDILEKDLLSI